MAVGVDVKAVRDGVRCRHARIVYSSMDGVLVLVRAADCRLWESFDGPYPLYLLAHMSRAGYWGVAVMDEVIVSSSIVYNSRQ